MGFVRRNFEPRVGDEIPHFGLQLPESLQIITGDRQVIRVARVYSIWTDFSEGFQNLFVD